MCDDVLSGMPLWPRAAPGTPAVLRSRHERPECIWKHCTACVCSLQPGNSLKRNMLACLRNVWVFCGITFILERCAIHTIHSMWMFHASAGDSGLDSTATQLFDAFIWVAEAQIWKGLLHYLYYTLMHSFCCNLDESSKLYVVVVYSFWWSVFEMPRLPSDYQCPAGTVVQLLLNCTLKD